MNLKGILIKKVNNGFLIIADYDMIIGKAHKEKFVFQNFDPAVSKIREILALKV